MGTFRNILLKFLNDDDFDLEDAEKILEVVKRSLPKPKNSIFFEDQTDNFDWKNGYNCALSDTKAAIHAIHKLIQGGER